MPTKDIEISEISRAGFVVEDQSVVLVCLSAGQPLEIRFPGSQLTWLISLMLHLAGKLEQTPGGQMTALLPEGMELCALPDDDVGLRFLLPGGAPLTFKLARDDARLLTDGLVAHLRTTTPSTTARQ